MYVCMNGCVVACKYVYVYLVDMLVGRIVRLYFVSSTSVCWLICFRRNSSSLWRSTHEFVILFTVHLRLEIKNALSA